MALFLPEELLLFFFFFLAMKDANDESVLIPLICFVIALILISLVVNESVVILRLCFKDIYNNITNLPTILCRALNDSKKKINFLYY